VRGKGTTIGGWVVAGWGGLATPGVLHALLAAALRRRGTRGRRGRGTTLTATGDTYLKGGSPNQNQGNETLLRLQSSGPNRSLVRFGQAEIEAAAGGSLVSATLELYVQSNGGNWGSTGRRARIGSPPTSAPRRADL
jgi:hypothetical protein